MSNENENKNENERALIEPCSITKIIKEFQFTFCKKYVGIHKYVGNAIPHDESKTNVTNFTGVFWWQDDVGELDEQWQFKGTLEFKKELEKQSVPTKVNYRFEGRTMNTRLIYGKLTRDDKPHLSIKGLFGRKNILLSGKLKFWEHKMHVGCNTKIDIQFWDYFEKPTKYMNDLVSKGAAITYMGPVLFGLSGSESATLLDDYIHFGEASINGTTGNLILSDGILKNFDNETMMEIKSLNDIFKQNFVKKLFTREKTDF